MITNSILIENRHKRFIKTVCETEIVYGLRSPKGYATSNSVHIKDEDQKSIGIICFWAEKALAKSCIKSDWANYAVAEISLTEFMENWCLGMMNDGLLAGTEFDQNMFGFEIVPFDLILELSRELNSISKNLNFRRFDGLTDLEKQVKAKND